MKLILEAIKALFRKMETNADTLSKRITKAQNTAAAAQKAASTAGKNASAAQNAANKAWETANSAQVVAIDAKSVASVANSAIFKKAELQNFECPLSIDEALEIDVGASHLVTQKGKMFQTVFIPGATVIMKFIIHGGRQLSAALTATGGYDAVGLLDFYNPSNMAESSFFLIRVGNKATTSYVELVRIA